MRALLMATLLAVALPAPAQVGPTAETVEVKSRRVDEPDLTTLRFLKDNRVFLRAQLDRLRLETHRHRLGAASALDPRYLTLGEMAAAIAAAGDTVDATGEDLDRRRLLANVGDLEDLEGQLDLMDSLLVDQSRRLTWLEEDFLGRQETALVVLVRGHAGGAAPTGLVLRDDDLSTTVVLTGEQQASLTRGGIVQIDHRRVEPRRHALSIALTGGSWDGSPVAVLDVTASRDRLTFLELDLASLDPGRPAADLAARVWQR